MEMKSSISLITPRVVKHVWKHLDTVTVTVIMYIAGGRNHKNDKRRA